MSCDSTFPGTLRRAVRALALACIAVTGCSAEPEPMPDDLLGTWTTNDAAYEDRSFEIHPDRLVWETGRYVAADRRPLVGVESQVPVDGWAVYRLLYRESDGVVSDIELHYRSKPEPTLRFANRRQLWTKRGAAKGST